MQISRSEQKRRVKEVEKLVAELSRLSPQVLNSCPLPKDTILLLKEVRNLKGGAAKRQLKYVTKLLKDSSLDEVYSFIGERKGSALIEKKRFHEVEHWRDSLINEAVSTRKKYAAMELEWAEDWEGSVIDELAGDVPGVDKVTLQRLAYLFVQTRNPKHSREIFRHIMAAVEQQNR